MNKSDWRDSKNKIEVSWGLLYALLGLPEYMQLDDYTHISSLKSSEARNISAIIRDDTRHELANILGQIFAYDQPQLIWPKLQRHKNKYVRFAAATFAKKYHPKLNSPTSDVGE